MQRNGIMTAKHILVHCSAEGGRRPCSFSCELALGSVEKSSITGWKETCMYSAVLEENVMGTEDYMCTKRARVVIYV